jgi:hypothetical protein
VAAVAGRVAPLTPAPQGAIVTTVVGEGGSVPEELPQRFFVTITAADPAKLREVGRFGLDLFSHRAGEEGPEIGGLVSLEDIGRLVEAGYRVTVHETDRPRRRHEYVEFDAWRKEMLADLERREKES